MARRSSRRDPRLEDRRARSSSTTRRFATAPRARTSPCRSRTSSGSRACSTTTGCPTSRAAGPARTPRTSSSSRPRRTSAGPTPGSPHSAPPATARTPPGDDPNLTELLRAETPVVTIFGKSWELHVVEVLGAGLEENLEMIAESVRVDRRARAASWSTTPSTSSTATAPIADYALSTLRAALEGGARTLVLCDTNGGTLTSDLLAILEATTRASSRPTTAARTSRSGIHTHNDAELAVANSLAAVQAGRAPRPGDDQRLRRALRQRQHGQRPGRPRAQDGPRAGARPAGASSRR